jgi:hypothetical protein
MTNRAEYIAAVFHEDVSGTTAIPYPSSRTGDLLTMLVDSHEGTPDIAGWSRVVSTLPSDLALYYRFRGAESSVTTGFTVGADVLLAVHRGIQTTAILRGAVGAAAAGWTLPDYTPAAEAATIVLRLFHDSGTAADPMPTPAGFVERMQTPKAQFRPGGHVSDRLSEPPGQATGPSTVRSDLGGAGELYGYLSVLPVMNTAPFAPLVSMPQAIDRTRDFDVAVTAQDPDLNDSTLQTFVRVRRRDETTPPAWTVLSRTSPTTTVTIPADTLPLAPHELQAATRDAGGLPTSDADLVWSGSVFFDAADPTGDLSFVTPTAGAVIGSASQRFTVSGPTYDTLEYRVLADDGAGAPDLANVLVPITASTDLQAFTVTGLVNSSSIHVQARAVRAGLAGAWASSAHPVSYTPPAEAPGSVVRADYSLAVTWRSPTPVNGQPAVLFTELERAVLVDDGGTLVPVPEGDPRRGFLRDLTLAGRQRLRLPPSGTYDDATVPSGVEHGYRVHAVGANGTRSAGPWFVGFVDLTAEVPDAPAEGDYADANYDPAFYA